MVTRNALLAGILLGVAACGDAAIGKLSENISRDSTLRILAVDAAAGDSAPHIYREDQYLVDGKFYKIAFYTATDRKQATDTVGGAPLLDDELTPLVFVNDTLTGWGWDHWEEVATIIKVPLAPR